MGFRAFYSFHYVPDGWRAAQVRNMGIVEGNQSIADNAWESLKRTGDVAVKRWINSQLQGRSCAIVLIGQNTANRKWINYEIETAWAAGKGVVGVYIHNLLDRNKLQSSKGANPFDYVSLPSGVRMSQVVQAYDPPFKTSGYVYSDIQEKLESLVSAAIAVRNRYPR
ncbi:TIR domain-containing protein [Spirillospora sp. NPDC127506]